PRDRRPGSWALPSSERVGVDGEAAPDGGVALGPGEMVAGGALGRRGIAGGDGVDDGDVLGQSVLAYFSRGEIAETERALGELPCLRRPQPFQRTQYQLCRLVPAPGDELLVERPGQCHELLGVVERRLRRCDVSLQP